MCEFDQIHHLKWNSSGYNSENVRAIMLALNNNISPPGEGLGCRGVCLHFMNKSR